VFSRRVRVRIKVRIRFIVWLVSGYAHVFVLLPVVIVTLPKKVFIVLVEERINSGIYWQLGTVYECRRPRRWVGKRPY